MKKYITVAVISAVLGFATLASADVVKPWITAQKISNINPLGSPNNIEVYKVIDENGVVCYVTSSNNAYNSAISCVKVK